MRRAAVLMSAAALVLFTAGLSAQGKPNFAGSWAPDAEKNAAAMGAGGGGGGGRGGRMGGGGNMTITQDATSITIERTGGRGNAQPQTYKLDGSEQTVQMGQSEAKVKASWEGNTIVIETTVDRGNGPSTTKAVYSMEGDELVVATTRPGRGGGEPTTSKLYYKKAS
jgi:hypothetical protein